MTHKENIKSFLKMTKEICKEQNWKYQGCPAKTAAAYAKAASEANAFISIEDGAMYRTLLSCPDYSPVNELLWLENNVELLTMETIMQFLTAILEETH